VADRPTPKQLEYIWSLAARARLPTPEVATRAQASEVIQKLRELVPSPGPTAAQRDALKRLGYAGPWPSSRREASEVIQRVLQAREDAGSGYEPPISSSRRGRRPVDRQEGPSASVKY
jgi:hypothetical protein